MTAETLKSSAMVVYPVHAVLLNFYSLFTRTLVWNGLTLRLLPVRCSGSDKGEMHEEGQADNLFVCGFSSSQSISLSI